MKWELNDRMKQILKFVINEFIDTGEPVGSRTIVKKYNINLSPATIRNIMSDLEDFGFLYQPYTSAGRVPTKKGLQYYVDTLVHFQNISEKLKRKIFNAVNNDELKLTEICGKISDIISEITNCVGVVIVPDIKFSTLNHLEFLRLTDSKVLAIIVNELGQVQNKIFEVDFKISQEELNKLSNYLNVKFQNKNIIDVKNEILKEMDTVKNLFNEKLSKLVEKFYKMDLKDYDLQKDVIIKGLKNFLQSDYFQKDFENLKKLLSLFEEKNKLIEILDKSIKNPGIQIFIGSQNKEFENLSIVTSSYSKNGLTLGSLGVIGPLRMNYNAIIPIVDCAAQIISTILDENFRRLR